MTIDKFITEKLDQLVFRFETSAQDDRNDLVINALHLVTQDLRIFLIGCGFFLANPHNEILRYFITMGFGGVIFFLYLLFVIFKYAIMSNNKCINHYFGSLLLFFFIIIAIQTYGHTKSMWTAFMLIFFLRLETNLRTKSLKKDMV